MRRTVGAIGVAAAIAGVGGAAIAAATDGGHSMIEGSMHGFGDPPPAAPATRHGDVAPDTLHGEYVVSDGHGGFSTLVSQTGRVTAISSTSVTARSDDGFSQTYDIRDTSRSPSVKVDDEVTINATRIGQATLVTTMQPPVSSGQPVGR